MANNQVAYATDYDIEPYVGMPIYFDDQGNLAGYGDRNGNRCTRCRRCVQNQVAGDSTSDESNSTGSVNCNSNDFESWPLAMAYVPWQSFGTTYSPEEALEAGTIFPELDLPFLGGGRR